ncbi:MAG: hypothetical protein IT373_04160, partial [Polyangiaceae bacterium]|nr:hypothetical protein [Polyangiaceae bacterium]
MAAWKAGILGCAALAMLGCKKDPEVPPQPTPDAGPPPVPTVVEPPDAGTPTVEFGPCAPDLSNGMLQQIMRRATTESANAKNELGYVCQVVREGETASVQVFLDAGGCYTFLGHAYPDVTEVDLT